MQSALTRLDINLPNLSKIWQQMSPKIKYFMNPNSTGEDNWKIFWLTTASCADRQKKFKVTTQLFSSHEHVWAHADEQFSPSDLWKCNSCPQEFGIFGCFLDPIKDHVVLLSASITFLCEGQNILNTLNRTIAFPREDRCGKYFVIQLVCELQSSRQYNTPQRYGGLIALSWKIYKFKRVCSKCRYVIMKLSKEIEPDKSSHAKVAEIVFVGSPRGAAPLRPRESRPEEHRPRIFPPVGSWS